MLRTVRAKFLGVAAFFVVWLVVATGFSVIQSLGINGDLEAVSRYVTPVKDAISDVRARQLEQISLIDRYMRVVENDGPHAPLLNGLEIEINAKQTQIEQAFRKAFTFAALGRAQASGHFDNGVLLDLDVRMREFADVSAQFSLGVERLLSRVRDDDLMDAQRQENLVRGLHRNIVLDLRNEILLLEKYAADTVENVSSREDFLIQAEFIMMLAAVVIGVSLAYYMAHAVVIAVRQVTNALNAVQSGKLDTSLDFKGKGDFARLADAFNRMTRELRVRFRMRERFGKYVDPKIVNNLINQETALETSEKRVMTVSVVNLTGFDWLAEHTAPEKLVDFLNDYLTAMTEPISGHSGIIDNFVGDRVIGFWGPPFCGEGAHAGHACQAALEQVARFNALKTKYADLIGDHGLDIRVGIATGEVVVGSIGTDKSRAYTVVGDCVNYANRLEKANRVYGTRILASHETANMATGDIEMRDLDHVVLLGTEKVVYLYEVLAAGGQLSDERQEWRKKYEAAMAHYRDGRFDEARPLYESVIEFDDSDFAAQLMMNRMERLERREQDREWNGTWVVRDPYERRDVES
ncbi:adenylate/guanylate cyclase domain-containing protein [Thalassospira lucentensis]|jgi:adenylate cyclase|uniref:Adenylate/guanylate cyclase domain-containing protein n=2 Tax=Thalassospira lucentensis TaxID=168935 RepID=A0A358HX25_9PROT|nr:adenylate/guanylate cyclase domain-containing protein [Thalassospira lucentensis]HBU99552.1 adenylate/guanylate cyclase domain-containing protein [Thalassospira lucentensis]